MVSKFSFCFMILLFVICVDESHSLKEGDVGACRGRVSSIATKRVPKYWTQYCRGTRNICRMRKWKIEPYVKWTMGTICCEGWQHDGEMDACKPICSTGCLNGTCVAPQQCQCNPPMYLDPSRRNTCLSPVCDAPCINSECINKQIHNYEHETTPSQPLQNGICECFNNTRRYNETHCAFCDENYKINSDLSCTPQCRTPCVNGECIAPNKCRCLKGYRYKDDFSCESYCHQCVNGKCIGPNKCRCLPGFLAVNDTHCEQCGCENGDCVSGLCICRDGYSAVDGVCEPVCSQPCVNGVCSAPGECTCFEEHNKSADPLVCCRPECGNVCDGNGECPLVACVPSSIATKRVPKYWTQYCRGTRNICRMRKWKIEPYVKWTMGTICCEGWQHDGEMDACKPICSTGCLNGTCVAPQQCQCNPPMYLDPSRRNTCLSPVCDAPCINSECINKQIHNYEHETTPSQPLQNGICECFNNTRRYNETHCAFCDENYKINSDLSCNPQCRTPCVNGECIAPNKCRCLEGYKYKDDFSCESYCHQCVNGKCIGPNKCQCLPGFLAVNDTHCEQCGCENGDCVSGLRICRDGYTLIDGVCEPVCSQPCVNGVCSAPGECKCFEEHNKSADPLVCCRPECGNVCDGNGECPLVACVPR